MGSNGIHLPGSYLGVDAISGWSLQLLLFLAPKGFFVGYSGFPFRPLSLQINFNEFLCNRLRKLLR